MVQKLQLRRVHDPIVSNIFCFNAFPAIFVKWDVERKELDSLLRQQIIDLSVGGEQRQTVSCSAALMSFKRGSAPCGIETSVLFRSCERYTG